MCILSDYGANMHCQRRFERVPFFCPLHVTVLPEGVAAPATSIDISIVGVGITSALSMERGRSVRVRFQFKNGSEETYDEEVWGRVAYSRADENGNRLGIEFLEPIRASTHPVLAHKIESCR
jgi:hypothetical protein